MFRLRHITLLCLFVSLCACGKSPQLPPPSHVDADALWQRYSADAHSPLTPFRSSFSLRFGTEGDTRRVTAILWGNSKEELRLDVNAGIGVTIAKILENHDTVLIYLPTDNVAFFHEGIQKPLFNVGVPMPLGLAHLTSILEGRYSTVFGTQRTDDIEGVSGSALPEHAVQFTLKDSAFEGTLVLDTQARPVRWQSEDTDEWTVLLAYRDDAVVPYKLTITHADTGKKALLLVKDRRQNLTPFTETQMQLILPNDTVVRPLKDWHAE